MSQWPLGDSFRSSAVQNSEVLQSWSYKEESSESLSHQYQLMGKQDLKQEHAPQANMSPAVRASSFHQDTFELWRTTQTPVQEQAPLALRFEPPQREEQQNLAARVDFAGDSFENQLRPKEVFDAKANKDSSPLSRIYDILDVHSASSRWLEQRGYLEAFKSPDCTLDLSFGMMGQASKVGAVVTAPDGSKRTVIACEGGSTFQRLTGSDGRELVKFLSSGQIVELNPQRA